MEPVTRLDRFDIIIALLVIPSALSAGNMRQLTDSPMNPLHSIRGVNLAAAISAGLALSTAPAVAEPYLFTGHARPPGAMAPKDRPSFSVAPPSSRYGKGASQLSQPLSARAAPPPSSICRRLVRDPRYGYVEVQFAC